MDETTFRILDALSRDFSRPTSINGLVGRIRELRKGAYYKNIYDKIQKLQKEGLVRTVRIGRNSEISLDFGSYRARDMLTEMELRKKQEALEESNNLRNILPEMEDILRQVGTISSASMISPERTIPLNRLELLVIFRETPGTEGLVQKEMLRIYREIRKLQDKRNAKMEMLALGESEFSSLLKADEWNPLGEMISGQIAFYYPQNFWDLMGKSSKEGASFREPKGLNPARILEKDMAYNMDRFGYGEIGTEIREGNKISLECIATAALMGGNARRVEAIPVMLAKNKPNFRLLIFLSRKYNTEGKLLGLLSVLSRIRKSKELEIGDRRRQKTEGVSDAFQPLSPSIEYAIKALDILGAREERADEKSIREKMRLYHAD